MSKLYVKARRPFRTVASRPVILPFPIHARVRLAALNDNVPRFGVLRPFRPESAVHLQGYLPNIITGTAAELKELAGQIELGMIDEACVDQAIITLTRCGEPPLNDVDRVVFWQAFGVPVFEMFIGFDSAILAFECELHEGWHLAPDVRLSEWSGELMLDAPGVTGLQTSLSGLLTNEKCPCGRAGQRLLQIEAVRKSEVIQPWAATA